MLREYCVCKYIKNKVTNMLSKIQTGEKEEIWIVQYWYKL